MNKAVALLVPSEDRVAGAAPPEVRAMVLETYGGSCCVCGSGDRPQVDHVIPVARGGDHHPTNLQVLCKPCNTEKGFLTMAEWVRKQGPKPDRGPNPPRYCLTCEKEKRGSRMDRGVCCVCRNPLPLHPEYNIVRAA